jgi:hypothetical protein
MTNNISDSRVGKIEDRVTESKPVELSLTL